MTRPTPRKRRPPEERPSHLRLTTYGDYRRVTTHPAFLAVFLSLGIAVIVGLCLLASLVASW